MKFNCANKNCVSHEIIWDTSNNHVGDAIRETGFMPIMDWGGGMLWLCPSCFKKAQEHALKIKEIIDNEYISLSSLLKERGEYIDK